MNRGPARKARAELDLVGTTSKSLLRSPVCSLLTVSPLLLSESAPFSGSLQGPLSFLFCGFSLLSNAEVPWAFVLSMGLISVQYRLTRISGFRLERKRHKGGGERERRRLSGWVQTHLSLVRCPLSRGEAHSTAGRGDPLRRTHEQGDRNQHF